MANYTEADRARKKHGKLLKEHGITSVAIEEVREGKKKFYVLVVTTPAGPNTHVPRTLEVVHGGNTVVVPVIEKKDGVFVSHDSNPA